MDLHEQYRQAIQTAKGAGMKVSVEERDGRLHFEGTVQTHDQANEIWDAIETVPTWQEHIVVDIRVTGSARPAADTSGLGSKTYCVKAGDTLGTIATAFFGDATASTDIYDANREQLSDPNSVRPGQILIIPQHVRK
jgi:nucleoid-associated protein YgaU